MRRIHRAATSIGLIGAVSLVSACAGPSPTVTADALSAIEGVEGYRFIQDLATLRAGRRVVDERFWVTTRSEGAYRAPDLYREGVVSTTDVLPIGGSWEMVAIGEDAWYRASESEGPGEWRETELSRRSRNPLLGAEAYAQGAAAEALEPAEGHPLLPGEGGCVMVAVLPGEGDPATFAIRLDATERRVASFFSDDGGGLRWTMQVEYELPSRAEFLRPTDVRGEE